METLKDPKELEAVNRQTVIDNLNEVYNAVEKLIQRAYAKKENKLNSRLRNIRTDVSQLLSDIRNKSIDGFSGNKGTLDDFYRTGEQLLKDLYEMRDTFSSLTGSMEKTDIFLLEDLIDNFKKEYNNRIIVDQNILKEFRLKQMEAASEQRVMAGGDNLALKKQTPIPDPKPQNERDKITSSFVISKESPGSSSPAFWTMPKNRKEADVKEDIETNVLLKIYNYMNVLENKYSTYQPEVSFAGEYIGKRKWKKKVSDKFISGSIVDSFLKPILTFETCWRPFDELRTVMQFVQNEASTVPEGKHKSMCLLNFKWDADIVEWAENYVHLRLIIYLYDLRTDSIWFNEKVELAEKLKVWHNTDNYVTLQSELESLTEQDEGFDAADVMKVTGLNIEGANNYISEMLKSNTIIDLGFGTSRYKGMKK
ncbi:MAG: hypothetical protein QCH31_04795 [Methanolobus sp.]|nr:hypothetical protein [Methanolobus sp.]